MRHVRMLGLCLVAAFALAAVFAAGSASAQPEWAGCIKLANAKGNYTEEKCETVAGKTTKGVFKADHKGAYEIESGQAATCVKLAKATGEYTEGECKTVSGKEKVKKVKGKVVSEEFVPNHKGKYEKAPQDEFTGEGGAGILTVHLALCPETCVNENGELTEEAKEDRELQKNHEYGGTIAVECTHESATGEATGVNAVRDVKVTFKGCVENLGHTACSNTSNPEEIVTQTLKGELGYTNAAKHEVGVVLQPEKTGGLFVRFSCAIGISTEVGVPQPKQGPAWYEPSGSGDGIISPITPVNKMTRTFAQVYSTNEESENIPNKFENGPLSVLEAALYNTEKLSDRGYWIPAGEEIENTNTVKEGYAEIKA